MNEQNDKACLNCNRTDAQVPLVTLTFKGEAKYICAQCLPVLIHKTQNLLDKLPGMDVVPPADH